QFPRVDHPHRVADLRLLAASLLELLVRHRFEDAQQLDLILQVGVWRYFHAKPLRTVAEFCRDDESALPARLHALNSGAPGLGTVTCAYEKDGRRTVQLPTALELAVIITHRADIVTRDEIPRLDRLPAPWGNVDILQSGGESNRILLVIVAATGEKETR